MLDINEVLSTLDRVYKEQGERLQEQDYRISELQESIASRMLALEDVGWTEIGGQNLQGKGPTLENLQRIAPRLREMATANPLFVRGAELIFAYCFGAGVEFTNIKATGALRPIMENRYNMTTLFSAEGLRTLNLAAFTDGNIVVVYDSKDKLFTHVPLEEIGATWLDPNDDSKIRYIQRTRARDDKPPRVEWIPLARWKNTTTKPLPKTLEGTPVSQTQSAYIKRENAQTGWTWGVPWSLAAMVWAIAYSTYLQDNAKLVKALSMIAWSLTKTTATGVQNAAAQFVSPQIGGTAVGTPGNAISSVGVPSAQVSMNNGQPLASMVATTFGVPVIALLSSPGATGGSYGAATTLDTPTILSMIAKQTGWADFLEEILHDIAPTKTQKPGVVFPPISQDQAYRAVQSITTANSFGLIHNDEAREGILRILPVPKLHSNLPPKPVEPVKPAGQGVSGPVPGGVGQDDTDHSSDGE